MDKNAGVHIVFKNMNKPGRHQPKHVLPIVSIVTFIGFLDTHLLIPVLALYADELGAGVGTIGLIIGVYSLTHTPANIVFGRLIDRIGYKIPLIAGLLGDALSMFLYSMSQLPVHLALVRVLHGITGALIGPATMSVTADYSGDLPKGKAMSFYGMSIGAATLFGYGLSGLVASRLGYKAVFFLGVGLLIVGMALSLLLPGRKAARRVRHEYGGFGRTRELITRKGLTIAYSSIFAQYFSFGGLVTLLPLYVKSLGMEAFHVGMLLAIFAVMFILLQFPSGALSDRTGRLTPTALGLLLGIVSLVALPFLSTFLLLLAAMVLYGTAYGLLFPSVSALVAERTVPEERGLATGIFHALLTAGVAIGAPVMGWVGEVWGVRLGLALSASMAVVALAVVLRNRRRI